jgi:hypothetical protein
LLAIVGSNASAPKATADALVNEIASSADQSDTGTAAKGLAAGRLSGAGDKYTVAQSLRAIIAS